MRSPIACFTGERVDGCLFRDLDRHRSARPDHGAAASPACRSGTAGAGDQAILSGFNRQSAAESDAGILLSAMGRRVTRSRLRQSRPGRFAAPLSIDMAARARPGGRFRRAVAWCRAQQARGSAADRGRRRVMAPTTIAMSCADWIARAGHAGAARHGQLSRTISHTLTRWFALRDRGIHVAAAIVASHPAARCRPGDAEVMRAMARW